MRTNEAGRRGIYYGWPLVGGVGLAQMTSWGILFYAYAIILKPMENELGWSRGTMTGAFSVALLCAGLAAIPVGRMLDRNGPRLLMTFGSIAATGLVLAWSRIHNLPGLFLVFAGIGLIQATVLYEPAFWIVTTWFRRKRSRALTFLTVLGGLASVIYVPLTERLVNHYGWREALVILAVILAFGTIPIHALLLCRRPQDRGFAPDGVPLEAVDGQPAAPPERSVAAREAIRGITFRWVSIAFFLVTLAEAALSLHLVPYLIERGYSSQFAAGMLALLGLLSLPGRMLFAPMRSLMRGQRSTLFVVACQPLGLLVLITLPGKGGVFAFVLLIGLGSRAITVARAAVISDLYGPAQYGSINGVLAGVLTIARALAPGGAGVLYDLLGGYTDVIILLIAAGAVAIIAVVMIERSALAQSLTTEPTPG